MQHETDSSTAGVQTRERFEKKAALLINRLKIFFQRRCKTFEEAARVDDWVQETMLRIARKVDDGLDIVSFDAYAMGTAKVVFQEYLNRPAQRSLNSQSDINGNALETLRDLRAQSDIEIRALCLDQCLLTLDDHSRTIIASWFGLSGTMEQPEVKEKGAGGSSTERVRVFRLVNRLRACCRKCMECEESQFFGVSE
jgi:DNA-directed RNA polymerase specialized sigma24 family protein